MRTLLRTVMYAVAFVAGADAYLVSLSLAGQWGLAAGWARLAAVILGVTVALTAATLPLAVYQRVMRRIVAQRRAARLATLIEPVESAPEATDPVEPPANRPRSNQTYGVTSREYRALQWPAPTRLTTPARR